MYNHNKLLSLQYPRRELSSVAHLVQGLSNLIVKVQCKNHQQMIKCVSVHVHIYIYIYIYIYIHNPGTQVWCGTHINI